MGSEEVQEFLNEFGEINDRFEETLKSFTTGDPDVTMKDVDKRFRELKTPMKKARALARSLATKGSR